MPAWIGQALQAYCFAIIILVLQQQTGWDMWEAAILDACDELLVCGFGGESCSKTMPFVGRSCCCIFQSQSPVADHSRKRSKMECIILQMESSKLLTRSSDGPAIAWVVTKCTNLARSILVTKINCNCCVCLVSKSLLRQASERLIQTVFLTVYEAITCLRVSLPFRF